MIKRLEYTKPLCFQTSQLQGWPFVRLEFFIDIPFKCSFHIDLSKNDLNTLISQLKIALEKFTLDWKNKEGVSR